MARRPRTQDPVERIVEEALIDAGVDYLRENGHSRRLDFYLPARDVWVEVKSMHSPRISDQMAGEKNVIAVQGEASARLFAALIRGEKI